MNTARAIGLGLVLTALGVANAATGEQSVPQRVLVSKDKVLVRHILPENLWSKTGQGALDAVIGVSPTLGRPQVLSGPMLKVRMENKLGKGFFERNKLTLPGQVSLVRAGQELSGVQLLAVLSDPGSLFAQKYPGFRATATAEAPKVTVPLGKLDIQAPSPHQPTLSIKVEGKEAARVNLGVFYKFEVPSLVSAGAFPKGHVLKAQDFQEVWVPIRNAFNKIDREDLLGQTLKTKMALGEAFNTRQVYIPPTIKRGEIVKILAVKNGMVIAMSGEALGDAPKGGLIRVRNQSLKRVLRATVLGPGLVQVEMSNGR